MDFSSEEGAKALAKEIEQYWHDRGYPEVKARTEKINMRSQSNRSSPGYTVKTNLTGRERT